MSINRFTQMELPVPAELRMAPADDGLLGALKILKDGRSTALGIAATYLTERDELAAEVERLRREGAYDQRNAAQSQGESAKLLSELDEARAESERLKGEVQAICARAGDDIREIETERDELAARLAVATEALKFYGDPITYAVTQLCSPVAAAQADEGRRARSALTDFPARAAAMLRVVEAAHGALKPSGWSCDGLDQLRAALRALYGEAK